MKNNEFTSPRGIKYHIITKSDGTFDLWMWSNPQSGWGFKKNFPTFEKAKANMVSGDPSTEWNPS